MGHFDRRDCPPLWRWPAFNLIANECPYCTAPHDPVKTVRELKARRLLEGR